MSKISKENNPVEVVRCDCKKIKEITDQREKAIHTYTVKVLSIKQIKDSIWTDQGEIELAFPANINEDNFRLVESWIAIRLKILKKTLDTPFIKYQMCGCVICDCRKECDRLCGKEICERHKVYSEKERNSEYIR